MNAPAPLLAAFAERVTIPLKETAHLLGMNESTLREHVQVGNIRYIQLGLGAKSIRRAFRLSDVLEFLEKMSRVENPPIGLKTRRVSGTAAPLQLGFTAMYEQYKAERERKREQEKRARARPP